MLTSDKLFIQCGADQIAQLVINRLSAGFMADISN